jgi:hypothetical protein
VIAVSVMEKRLDARNLASPLFFDAYVSSARYGLSLPREDFAPHLVTLAMVALAAIASYVLYWQYSTKPWTDGQVRAISWASRRVAGPIIQIPIQDNQAVKKGDLLLKSTRQPLRRR